MKSRQAMETSRAAARQRLPPALPPALPPLAVPPKLLLA
jgi:hypothetical protein